MFRLEGSHWLDVSRNESDFPSEGTVFTYDLAARNLQEDAVFQFSIEPNRPTGPSDYAPYQKDQYVAPVLRRPIAVVDLSHLTNDHARQLVVEIGLTEADSRQPLVHFRLAEDLWAVFRMEKSEADGKYRPHVSENLEKVSLLRARGPAPIVELEDLAYLSCDVVFDPTGRVVDWSSDEQFAGQLMKRLRKILGSSKTLPAEAAGETLTAYLRGAALLPKDRNDAIAFRDRLFEFLTASKDNIEVADEIFSIVRNNEVLQKSIDAEVAIRLEIFKDGVRTQTKQEAKAAWDDEQTSLIKARDVLRRELDAMETQHRASIGRATETRKKIEAVEAGLLGVVDGLKDVLSRAPKSHYERARVIGRQIEKSLGITEEGTLFPAEAAPWNLGQALVSSQIPISTLKSALTKAAESGGFDDKIMSVFDALVRAGEIPILAGTEFDRLLVCYSMAVTGGRIRRMPLDPGIIGLDDIWRQPGTGKPTAFSFAWSAAKANAEMPVLLILESIESAERWGWCRPLAEFWRSPHRPRNLLLAISQLCKSSGKAEEFDNAKSCFIKLAPAVNERGRFSVATRLASGLDIKPTFVGGLTVDISIEDQDRNDLLDETVLDRSFPLSTAERVVSLYRAARLTMDHANAKAIAVEFADHFEADCNETNFFSLAGKSFVYAINSQ